MSTITLPNLRIIRGQDTFSSSGGPVSLLVQGFTNGFLNLPSLTEISNGRAVFVSTSGTCGFLNVLWTDILSNGGPPDYSMSGCTTPSSDCSSCPSKHCWSSGTSNCQNLTKSGCPQGCGRCFMSPGDGSYQCCSSLCAAGCYGSSSSQCYACSILNNNGSCVTECPPAQVYDPALFMLVNNPNYRLASGGLCVQQCAGNLLEYAGTCVTSCPVGYTPNGAKCVACSGVCPRVCTGTDANGVVMGGNFTQFTSCTILNGSLAISDSSLTNSMVQSCVALHITLQSIDLSSLEVIQYGGYVLGGNSQLCYVGNFTRHLANTNLPVCLSASNSRRDPATCTQVGEQLDTNYTVYELPGPSGLQAEEWELPGPSRLQADEYRLMNEALLKRIKVLEEEKKGRLSDSTKLPFCIEQIQHDDKLELKEIDWIPSVDQVFGTQPIEFREKFPSTYAIIDGSEVFIETPSDLHLQSSTWSQHKHHNTDLSQMWS
eukprot:Em0012g365a